MARKQKLSPDAQERLDTHPGSLARRDRRLDMVTVASTLLERYGEVPTTFAAIVYEMTTMVALREVFQLLQMQPVDRDGRKVYSPAQYAYARKLLIDVGAAFRANSATIAATLFPRSPSPNPVLIYAK